MDATPAHPDLPETRRAVSRVPEITAAFWVITVLAAGAGETASDFLFTHLPHVVVLAIGTAVMVVALVFQLRARRYVPRIYWFCVAMAAVSGTMPADVARVGLGIPATAATVFFLVALAVIVACWYWSERTLSIDSIRTRRRESFYWAAVFVMFSLGTAAGDMTANTLHMGYLVSALAFGAVLAVLLAARTWSGLNAVAAFWLTYVVTRPLGASLTDWLAQRPDKGGLGWGTGPVTVVLTIAIIGLVCYLTRAARKPPMATAPQNP